MLKYLCLAQTSVDSGTVGNSAIVAFVLYIGLVLWLAWLSSRVVHRKSFLNEYFLGGRSLGVWAFALTFAATSASGGSFIGFPSLVYTHGWSVALWIASYMLVPLVAMGLLAKRLNQLARKTDAITIPDLIQSRFASPGLGLLATLLIVFFMAFNLIAQFKGGSVILQTLLSDVGLFQDAAAGFGALVEGVSPGLVAEVEPAYLLCLVIFALAVVAYTTYGGFRAVVWTDVLQGFVMVVGILILLPMTLWAVGGLGQATRKLASSQPPMSAFVALTTAANNLPAEPEVLSRGSLLRAQRPDEEAMLVKLMEDCQLTDLGKLLPLPDSLEGSRQMGSQVAVLALDPSSEAAVAATDPRLFQLEEFHSEPLAFGSKRVGVYTTGPGPSSTSEAGFLPLAAAISFFCFWCFGNAGHPSNMVRCMAFRDSRTLGRAIFTVSIYYSLIYFPIVIIFCCARTLLPGWEGESDRIMPEIASHVTTRFGVPWLAGLLVAAPFAAVMSTMDSFLLMISSSVVRDIYQRWINPEPSAQRIKYLTYGTTLVVGVAAMLAAVNPPLFLQDIIVFTGSGLATSFLVPIGLSLYWPRFNAYGAMAGMASGFLSNLVLYAIGYWMNGRMSAFEPLGIHPFLLGGLLSLACSIGVTLATPAPSREIVLRFFYRRVDVA